MVRVSDVKVKSKSSSCQLSIFEKEADVKQATEKLCVITSEPAKTVSASYDDLRPLGCKCGADALIITTSRREQQGHRDGLGRPLRRRAGAAGHRPETVGGQPERTPILDGGAVRR